MVHFTANKIYCKKYGKKAFLILYLQIFLIHFFPISFPNKIILLIHTSFFSLHMQELKFFANCRADSSTKTCTSCCEPKVIC